MPAYKNTEQMHTTMLDLWHTIGQHSDIADKILESKMIVRFHYREPDALITIDASNGKELQVFAGDNALKADVEMFMKSDVAHEFWLGQINVPMAILTGKMPPA